MVKTYSYLAKQHGLDNKNKQTGCHNCKRVLIEQVVNLQHYQQFRKRPANSGCVSTLKTNRNQRSIQVKLEAGECTVGEFVVPKQYKKLIQNSDGTLKKVSGTKIPNQEKGTREV
ncbi:uncharacterized protein LOC141859700 isoform X2 [Acropora palmata]|uniref:uncharacterized protein LOC141859700 isoform X2 n=1 Tax=Acropora palmata TaxID=6131 RepID=UPI003DA06BCF